MKRTVGMIGIVVLGAVLVGHTATARQDRAATPGTTPAATCAALDAYATAMLETGTVWADAMERDGLLDREPQTFSAPEWIGFAEHYEALQTAIKQITPPPVAAGWHQNMVEHVGLTSSLGRTVATSGLFAAIAFTDQVDALRAEGNEQRRQIEAACPEFEAFHRQWDLLDGEVNREDATPTAGATPTQAGGTRDTPVPLGTAADVGDWTVTVTDVVPDATAQIMTANQFNEPPPAGTQFYLITLEATYHGDEPVRFSTAMSWSAVGESAVSYSEGASRCGVIPEGMSDVPEVFEGGTIEGNICFAVRAEDLGSLVLYLSPRFGDENVFFALRQD